MEIRIRDILVADLQPEAQNVLWLKPIEDGFGLYIHRNGGWRPLKILNTMGTTSPDDDKPYNLDVIGATKLSDLEDVSLNTLTDGQVLKYNGTTWENGEDEGGGDLGPDTVGTTQIINNSVLEEDLNSTVRDKIQKTYYQGDESLHMDYDVANEDND